MHYVCKHIHVHTHTHTHTHIYISGNQRLFHKKNVGCTLIYFLPQVVLDVVCGYRLGDYE